MTMGRPSPAEQRARQLFMIATIARLLDGAGHVAVGSTSPVPASGALLARRRNPGMRVSILGSERHNAFTDGNRELFDCAAQGRIDAFFLSGGQIDGMGRINLVGLGPYPETSLRFPGSFGSAFLYPLVPRVILFREVHSPRTLVERVDFVSAAPGRADRGDRNAGPVALVTGLAHFSFDREAGRFALAATAPGVSPAEIRDTTGFGYDAGRAFPFSLDPDLAQEVDAIVRAELADDYPAFARRWTGEAAAT